MTEFLLSIFYFIVFCLFISKLPFFKDNHIPRYWFIVIFGIKIIFSIALTIIYTKYYTNREMADIYKYFDDSKFMYNALSTHPLDYIKMLIGIDNDTLYFTSNYYVHMNHWTRAFTSDLFSDSHTIIRFNAFVRLFSFGYFQVHNIFINFLSLIGLTAIYKAFKYTLVVHNEKTLFYAIFLIPSVLFWGSGLLKESILFFAIGLLILNFFKLFKAFTILRFSIIVFTLIVITYTKLYIAIVLIPSFIGYIIYKTTLRKNALLSYFTSFMLIIITSFSLNSVHSKYDPFQLLVNKQADFITLINREDIVVKSNFTIPIVQNQMDIIKNIPNAFLNTFIRPYLWESKSYFTIMCSVENLILLLFILFSIIYRRKSVVNLNHFLFCLFFVVSLFLIIGISTPVFGAIARYKVPGLPFLMIALLIIVDLEKIKLKLPFLSKIL